MRKLNCRRIAVLAVPLVVALLVSTNAIAPALQKRLEVRIGRVEFWDECDPGTKDCEPIVKIDGVTRNCNGQSAGGDGIIEDCQEVVVRDISSFRVELDEDDVFNNDEVDIAEDGDVDVWIAANAAYYQTSGLNGANNDCPQTFYTQDVWCVLDDQDPGSPDRGQLQIKLRIIDVQV